MDFTEYIDLAAERLGGRVLAANDEFFAPKENLLKAAAPVWIEGKYTDVGKWMDGWETRRRRTPGYDWCIVKLGLPGVIHGVVVDTSYFKGNFPEHCEFESCAVDGDPGLAQLEDHTTKWNTMLKKSPLAGDTRNPFPLTPSSRVTHLRFKIYPDGGVARLRVHGEAVPDWPALTRARGEIDLAAVEHGGWVIISSDMFFGSRNNLILPGRSTGMHDGWETRRRRGPGHDWCIVRLGRARKNQPHRSRYLPFQRQFPGKLLARSLHGAARSYRSGLAGRPSLERNIDEDEAASRFHAHLRKRTAGCTSSDARAFSHLPRWRRGAAAHLWNSGEDGKVT